MGRNLGFSWVGPLDCDATTLSKLPPPPPASSFKIMGGGLGDDDPISSTGSYSELLFCDEIPGLDPDPEAETTSSRGSSGNCIGSGSGTGRRKSKIRRSSAPTGHATGKKERLREKISVLQQLVSPFGKTDTASVLEEALGYIKFLQEQVKVLFSPYIRTLPREEEVRMTDLRSRGLCLCPADLVRRELTESNGADLYSSTSAAT
ncbi:hypothetical protein M569_02201 [Genlisea aurea]|uniref:BHLH domain-containing protein n=1 Tax=Genlisea aurea TaxID=192259 RepID=S8CZQ2_9LAMI|nr:hypothetical protein M569_02201 [Genlisea aurea]